MFVNLIGRRLMLLTPILDPFLTNKTVEVYLMWKPGLT